MTNYHKKILIISPHLDDEVLGCGGTIQYFKKTKSEVNVIFIADRKYNNKIISHKIKSDRNEANKAKKLLKYDKQFFLGFNDESLYLNIDKIIIELVKLVKQLKPDTIFCCSPDDNNHDHYSTFVAAKIVMRWVYGVKNVYLYEVPSSSEVSPNIKNSLFEPNLFVNIDNFIQNKIKALNCYKSEKRSFPNARSKEGIITYAKFRGMMSGHKNAEAFRVIKQII